MSWDNILGEMRQWPLGNGPALGCGRFLHNTWTTTSVSQGKEFPGTGDKVCVQEKDVSIASTECWKDQAFPCGAGAHLVNFPLVCTTALTPTWPSQQPTLAASHQVRDFFTLRSHQKGFSRIPVPNGEKGLTLAHISAALSEIADLPSSRTNTGPWGRNKCYN